jgi:hypothetical protein
MRMRFALGLAPVLCFLLPACGSDLPQGQAPRNVGTAPNALSEPEDEDGQPFTAADCTKLLDPGLRAECLLCAGNPNAFQGCTVKGALFNPATCSCVTSCAGLGSAQSCGRVCCPAGGSCCHAGTSPFAVEFCELPGSTLPPYLQPFASCAPICPPGTTVCGANCRNLQTDPNHCGTCGTACRAGQTCPAGVCVPPPDAGLPPPDAGLPPPDAGLPPPDAGLPPPDAGLPRPDGGLPFGVGLPRPGAGLPSGSSSLWRFLLRAP